jgi:imidazolonepropionase-like amidohydrolase
MGYIADGVDEVRFACRKMIKEGARFIKVMANGGVSSPNDPIHSIQYSRDEILAMVEEAENAGTYVSAHVYTDARSGAASAGRAFAGALQPDHGRDGEAGGR